MDQTLHRLAETFGIVTPRARQRKLPPALRQLHQHILRHFALQATAPEPARLREWAQQLDIELGDALDQLVSVDLVASCCLAAALAAGHPPARAARTSRSTARPLPLLRTCRPPTSPEKSSPNHKR